MEDDVKKFFTTEDYYGEECVDNVRIHKFEDDVEIPLQAKYVYADIVMSYRNDEYDYDTDYLESGALTEKEYGLFCETYLKNPKYRKKIWLEYDEEEISTTPKDYIYYQWIDYGSKEWEKFRIEQTVIDLGLRWGSHNSETEELVVLEVHG